MATYVLTQTDIDVFTSNNATLEVDGALAAVGTSITDSSTIEAICDSGYIFTSTPNFGRSGYNPVTSMFDTPTDMVLGDPPTTATYTFDGSASPRKPFRVSTDGAAQQTFKIPASFFDGTQGDIAVLVNDVEVVAGFETVIGDELKLVLNDSGYVFTANLSLPSNSNSTMKANYDPVKSKTPTRTFLMGATASEVYLIIDEYIMGYNDSTRWQWFLDLVLEQVIIEVSGTNNVYVVNNVIVEQVNRKRFVATGVDETGNEEKTDYGQYILSILNLPTEISEDLLANAEDIVLGDYSTEVSAVAVVTDSIAIDMGEITTPAPNGNLNDFNQTICVLHLPYSQPINIDPEYVIGQTIAIEYIVDTYTGDATININSTKVGEVFLTRRTTLGFSIPYGIVNDGSASAQNTNIVLGGDNRILKPYLEVIRNEALLVDGVFTIPITDEDDLINHTGFVRVEEIELEMDGSYSEKESVLNTLSNGVIIK